MQLAGKRVGKHAKTFAAAPVEEGTTGVCGRQTGPGRSEPRRLTAIATPSWQRAEVPNTGQRRTSASYTKQRTRSTRRQDRGCQIGVTATRGERPTRERPPESEPPARTKLQNGRSWPDTETFRVTNLATYSGSVPNSPVNGTSSPRRRNALIGPRGSCSFPFGRERDRFYHASSG